MKISGFTMGKNAHKLYYPLRYAIESILPLVDEFVVALGDSDDDDTSRKEIDAIGSEKIRIVDTVWDIEKYPRGMEHAHQTDIAKSYCTGDWLFYLQSDELVHEKDHNTIKERCEELLEDREVEGLLFKYLHFWGDYNHIQDNHCWYRNEIRIIRNDPEIHSWESAQSFRRIPGFDGLNYRQQKHTSKLKVARVNATIYHYGWVRHPRVMQNKIKAFTTNHEGTVAVDQKIRDKKYPTIFDYGNLSYLSKFEGSHPEVLNPWISKYDWIENLRFHGPKSCQNPMIMKHDKFKYRLVSWIEKKLLFGHRLGEFRNFRLLNK
jgi:hypothetical protein